jgi:hypothetical protein
MSRDDSDESSDCRGFFVLVADCEGGSGWEWLKITLNGTNYLNIML